MVHSPNLWYMPSRKDYKRHRKQLWLFYTMESPRLSFCSMHYDLRELDDWFNITVTYKSDSDFIVDYKPFKEFNDILNDKMYISEFDKLSNETKKNPMFSFKKIALKKKNDKNKATIVWFVSHCETNSKREDFVLELMKYIRVDIYGNCLNYFKNSFKHPCGDLKNENVDDCNNNLLNSYKFYLAFENSLCED
jgi:hypothetical protein